VDLLLAELLLMKLLLAKLLLTKLLLTMVLLADLLMTVLLLMWLLLLLLGLLFLLRLLLLPLLLGSSTYVVCQSLLYHQAGGEITYSSISIAALDLISAAFPAGLISSNFFFRLRFYKPFGQI
jgi:hypothetical protein